MSSVEVVVATVVAFFAIGIIVGVIAVIAMSAIRTDRSRRDDLGGRPGDDGGASGWEEPPKAGDEDDSYPRWPGGSAG